MANCFVAYTTVKVLLFNGKCNFVDYSDPNYIHFINQDSYGNTKCLALIPHSEIKYVINTEVVNDEI